LESRELEFVSSVTTTTATTALLPPSPTPKLGRLAEELSSYQNSTVFQKYLSIPQYTSQLTDYERYVQPYQKNQNTTSDTVILFICDQKYSPAVADSIASLRVDGKYIDDIAVIVDEKLDNPNDTFTKHDMYSMIMKEYPRQTNIFMYSATELLDSLFETSDTTEPHILSNPPPVSPCKSAHRKAGHAAYYRKVLAYHPTIALQWRYVMGMDACMTYHLPLVEMIFDLSRIQQPNKLLAVLDPMRWSFRGMKANLHSYGKKDHSKNPDCKFDSNAENFLRHVINNANGQGGSGSGGGGGISARQQDELPSSQQQQQQQSSQQEDEEEEVQLDQRLQLRRRLMEEEPANSSTSNGNDVNVTPAEAATTTISTLSSIGGTFGSDSKKKKRRGKKRKEKGPANVVEEQDIPAPTVAAATATFRTYSTYSIGRKVNATSRKKKKEKKTGPRFEQDVLKSTPYFNGAMMMYDTSIVRNYQYVTRSASSTTIELMQLHHVLGQVFDSGDQMLQSTYWMHLRRHDFAIMETRFWHEGGRRGRRSIHPLSMPTIPYQFEPPKVDYQPIIMTAFNDQRPVCTTRAANKAYKTQIGIDTHMK
jgi:hypothetical protein